MIALSLVIYLGISAALILPFILRYRVVTRNERYERASARHIHPHNGHALF